MSQFGKRPIRRSTSEPVSELRPTDWVIALAGGEGARLADYVERRFGRRLPKQYCRILGRRTMLEHTLDRLNEITPASRTLTVIGTHHSAFATPQLAGRSDHVICQPCSRDTGVALYAALAMIRRWTPHALVTITPTDHYVSPAPVYVDHVRTLRRIAARLPDSIVIVGAPASEPDPDFGYLALEPGSGHAAIARVLGFVEKPPLPRAKQLFEAGALWNTMVTCASLDALWELGRATQPLLIDAVDQLVLAIGTPDEEHAIERVYRASPPVSFSSDMLERAPERLVSYRLDGVTWSDWGRPERIESVLAARNSLLRGGAAAHR